MMRIVFMATGEIAEPTFATLLSGKLEGVEVVGLVTQPDRPVGRKQILTAPGVKELAIKAGVPVIQPEKVKAQESMAQLVNWAPDLIVVMAYGQILTQALIDLPKRAIINLHASLLPKYRGASCIQAALINGDQETGWSVIHVVKKLDAGNIILQEVMEIEESDTGGSLHDRLAAAGPDALRKALDLMKSQEVPGELQNEAEQTYAPKLDRNFGRLDWSLPAANLERLIRALHPWPGTFTMLGSKRLKIFPSVKVVKESGTPGSLVAEIPDGLVIACGEGGLVLKELQLEGSRRMSAIELARGHRDDLDAGLK